MLPLVRSARSAWPDARITVAVQASYAGLFKYLPFVDAVLPLERTQSPWGLLRAFSIIRRIRFDLSCSVSPGFRNSFLTLGSHAPAKVGYFNVTETPTPFLEQSPIAGIGVAVEDVAPYGGENIMARSEKICDALGIRYVDEVAWDIPHAVRDAVRSVLMKGSQAPGSRLCVLHPFAGWRYREWEFRKYLLLAAQLCSQMTVVIAGTQSELERSTVAQQLPRGVLVFNGSVLEDYTALLSQAQLFIGSDSGPLHLAASLGIPSVGLFGPASPELTGPRSPVCTALYQPVECSPCNQQVCVHPEKPCMSLIGVEQVLAAARSVMQRELIS